MTGSLEAEGLASRGRLFGQGVQLATPAAAAANVEFLTDNRLRWTFGKGTDPETGANTGSSFNIAAWSDIGAWKSNPLSINRETGVAKMIGIDLGEGNLIAGWFDSAYGGWVGGNIISDATPVDPNHLIRKQDLDDALAGAGGGSPTGAITMFGGSVAPEGWWLCDGTAHGSAALEAVIGSPTTPNLLDRFIVGAGSTYAVGEIGGANSVTLNSAQSGLPSHDHAAQSQGETQEHTHVTDPGAVNSGTVSSWHVHSGTSASGGPTHTHDDSTQEGITTGDSNDWLDTADDDTTSSALQTNTVRPANTAIGHTHTLTTGNPNLNHVHAVEIAATASGGRSAVHTHAIIVGSSVAQDAALPHENRPPFYALTYIIKL